MKAIHRYLSKMGRKGGEAGTGAKKRRGGTDYYRAIALKGVAARKMNREKNSVAKLGSGQ